MGPHEEKHGQHSEDRRIKGLTSSKTRRSRSNARPSGGRRSPEIGMELCPKWADLLAWTGNGQPPEEGTHVTFVAERGPAKAGE